MEWKISKGRAISGFRDHVSSAKADFWTSLNMDFIMGRREGCWMWDMEGSKRLFNLHCNGGVYNLGHRNGMILQTLRAALEELDIGNGHLMSWARAELATRIAESMPGDLQYTVFGVSGGEAVDLAIKVARGFTGKSLILSARGGYHGHTGFALAAGDEKYRMPFGPQAPGFAQVPFGNLDALKSSMGPDTAAVLLETVPATLGMLVPTKSYLQGVRRLCDETGALLVLDEVQTGFGRTGRLWGFEHFDVIPDMVVLGKGMSGGIYPLTATVLRKPLESVFHPDPFIHVSTFGGAEVGCLVALKVLEVSSDPSFLARVRKMAMLFSEGVLGLRKRHPVLREFRQLGLFMALRMKNESCGPLLCAAAYENDLFMVYANNDPSVAQLLPPLVIEEEEVAWVLERLDRALAAVGAARGAP